MSAWAPLAWSLGLTALITSPCWVYLIRHRNHPWMF